MKNKTIFIISGVVLFLIFTSLGYGEWVKRQPQPFEPREIQRADNLKEPLRAHGWQGDENKLLCKSSGANGSTSDVNLTRVNNGGNVTTILFIRFGSCNLFFRQHKSESTSDKKSETFSSEK
jgi:hypothetical protein